MKFWIFVILCIFSHGITVFKKFASENYTLVFPTLVIDAENVKHPDFVLVIDEALKNDKKIAIWHEVEECRIYTIFGVKIILEIKDISDAPHYNSFGWFNKIFTPFKIAKCLMKHWCGIVDKFERTNLEKCDYDFYHTLSLEGFEINSNEISYFSINDSSGSKKKNF